MQSTARGAKAPASIFSSAVTWDILISIPLVLAGIFIPDKILQLLGADAGLTALGKQYSALFWLPRRFLCPTTRSRRLRAMTALPAIAMLGSIRRKYVQHRV